MIILIAFQKQQVPSTKLQTAGDGKGWASENRKLETGNLFSMITLIALIIFKLPVVGLLRTENRELRTGFNDHLDCLDRLRTAAGGLLGTENRKLLSDRATESSGDRVIVRIQKR
jgi:hypothetical protein